MRPSKWLAEHGWCQGSLFEGGRGCLLGAVLEATETSVAASKFMLFVERRHPRFAAWNDAPERTKEEVIALLKEVEAEVYGIEHPVPWAEKGLAYASIHSRAD